MPSNDDDPHPSNDNNDLPASASLRDNDSHHHLTTSTLMAPTVPTPSLPMDDDNGCPHPQLFPMTTIPSHTISMPAHQH